MDYFNYLNGELHAEDVNITQLAEQVGTPFYCYSAATLARHYQVFDGLFAGVPHRVCYAMKANDALGVVALLAKLGAGADVVSMGEIIKARRAGVAADKIVFSGVGKTQDEMAFALNERIYQFNVESAPELEALNAVALALGVAAPVALRVNPDVDPKTHAKISTGQKESKFGIGMQDAMALYAHAMTLPGIRLQGVSVHIGSQLLDLAPFRQAFERVASFVTELRAQGMAIRSIDVGGGFGIRYREDQATPSLEEYAAIIRDCLGHLTKDGEGEIVLEPGRVLVGNAGILVSRAIYVKEGESKRFLILDAGMNDLMRPTLYSAYHEIVPVREMHGEHAMDVVGPVCETGDLFAEGRMLPEVQAGDLVAFRSAGAYGAVMTSHYNSRPRLAEVMVNGPKWQVIAKRETHEDLLARQVVPEWL